MAYSKKLALISLMIGIILILCSLADDAVQMQPFRVTVLDLAGLLGGTALAVFGAVIYEKSPEGEAVGGAGYLRRLDRVTAVRLSLQIGAAILIGALLFALPDFIRHTSQAGRFLERYTSRYFVFLAAYILLIAGIGVLLGSSFTAWGRRKLDTLLNGLSTRHILWLLLLSTITALGWLIVENRLWFGDLASLDIAASVPIALSIVLVRLCSTNDSNDQRGDSQKTCFDWPVLVTDGAVVLLAAWTFAQNLSYYLDQSLLFTVGPFAVTAVGLWLLIRRLDRVHPTYEIPDLDQAQPAQQRFVFIVTALVMWLLALVTRSLLFIWAGALTLSAMLLILDLRASLPSEETKQDAPTPVSNRLKRSESLLIIALCVIGTAFALILNRPDKDDSVYLNIAATVAEAPDEPLPPNYPTFSNEDFPYPYPTFPLMSYCHLIGLMSLISGMQPMVVSAFIILPLFSLLMVLAYARLLRMLAPKNWQWMMIALIALFLIDSSTRVMFTNYGFSRIWQGKSFFYHALMPLAAIYAFRFGAVGNRRDWLLLFITQIAMVSTTSMAFWMGPTAAGIALLAGVVYAKAPFKRLLTGLGASLYPLAIGLGAYLSTRSVIESRFEVVDWATEVAKSFGEFDSFSLWAWLGFVIFALTLAPNRRSRLLIGFSYAVVFGVFWNPLLKELVSRYITSSFIYWRIVWMLPLAVVGAVILSLPARFPSLDRRARVGAAAGCIVIYTLLVPQIYIFSPENEAAIEPFSVKADRGDYAAALELTDMLPPRSLVIVPEDISWILSAQRGYLQPIAPRHNQLRFTIRDQLGDEEEYEFRVYLLHYTAGKRPFERAYFEQALDRWDIKAVVVVPEVQDEDELADFLEEAGFRQEELGDYLLWLAP